MKFDRSAKRDVRTFVGVALLIFILSPMIAVFAIILGAIILAVSGLMARLAQWEYTRTLMAVGGGFVMGSLPYFLLAVVLILTGVT